MDAAGIEVETALLQDPSHEDEDEERRHREEHGEEAADEPRRHVALAVECDGGGEAAEEEEERQADEDADDAAALEVDPDRHRLCHGGDRTPSRGSTGARKFRHTEAYPGLRLVRFLEELTD